MKDVATAYAQTMKGNLIIAVPVAKHPEARRKPFDLLSVQGVSLGLRATAIIVCYAWVIVQLP